jgi:hypothetical protein
LNPSYRHPEEKYFEQTAERIARSIAAYERLDELSASVAALPAPAASPPAPSAGTAPAPAAPAAGAMTNTDVIDLRKAGLDDANLIAAIKAAPSVRFDLSPDGLRALLAAKVSNAVIAAMRAR